MMTQSGAQMIPVPLDVSSSAWMIEIVIPRISIAIRACHVESSVSKDNQIAAGFARI